MKRGEGREECIGSGSHVEVVVFRTGIVVDDIDDTLAQLTSAVSRLPVRTRMALKAIIQKGMSIMINMRMTLKAIIQKGMSIMINMRMTLKAIIQKGMSIMIIMRMTLKAIIQKGMIIMRTMQTECGAKKIVLDSSRLQGSNITVISCRRRDIQPGTRDIQPGTRDIQPGTRNIQPALAYPTGAGWANQ